MLAVLAVVIPAWVTWRSGNRRPRLEVVVRVERFGSVSKGRIFKGLTVANFNVPIETLYVVTIFLENVGAADVATRHFDGRSLRLTLLSPVLTVWSEASASIVGSAADDPEGVVEIPPMLIKRRASLVAEILVSGKPTPKFLGELVDADIVLKVED